jgi:Putative peptidoglycan binding domain
MKTIAVSRWFTVAAIATSLTLSTQTMFARGMGGFSGGGFNHHSGSFHRFGDHGFFRHDAFFRNHRRFFVGFDFVGLGFPYWWYPDYYYYGYYGYPDADAGYSYDYRYWYGLGTAVQTQLARRGYYHRSIDGVIGPESREAIQAFQRDQGEPVTGLVEPGLLKALKLPPVQGA